MWRARYGVDETPIASGANVAWLVFIGGAASISFLQVIRQIVAKQIGPTPFSHNDKSETMLEIEPTQDLAAPPEMELEVPELSVELKHKYLQCYHSVVRPQALNRHVE